MGKKKNNNNNNKENANDNEATVEKKKNDGGGGGGDAGEKIKDDKNSVSAITVVLKVDMHCEGCASKIVKCVRSFEGVETVKAEMSSNKITIVGAVDPSKIRDKLDQKTKKKIDLIFPQLKKDDNKDKEPKPKDKTAEDKKPKETPVTTAVLKLGLHCQGCIGKIKRIVSKTKGVIEMSVDKQKELVTVRGTMDTKALTETLKERLKRPVEIISPPKKEKDNKESNGVGDKNNNGNGDSKGGKKNKGGSGGADGGQEGEGGGGGVGAAKMEGNRMEYLPMGIPGPGHGYGYQVHGGYEYGYPVGGHYPYPVGGLQQHHAPQIFSDENPNACSVM